MYSTELIVTALEKSNGLITVAAKSIGCNPNTIRQRAKKEPEIQTAIDNARESLVDLAEKKLRTALNKGAPWAISLVLKTLGKNRGYVERAEITGADSGAIQIEEVNGAGERILSRIDSIATRLATSSNAGADSPDSSGQISA